MENLLEVRRLWSSFCHRPLSFPITFAYVFKAMYPGQPNVCATEFYLPVLVFFPFVKHVIIAPLIHSFHWSYALEISLGAL